MTQIKVKKYHDYAGRPRRVGDSYTLPNDHAVFLVAQGFAEVDSEKKPEVKKATYSTASLTPEAAPEKPKRTYTRRDMTAEDKD